MMQLLRGADRRLPRKPVRTPDPERVKREQRRAADAKNAYDEARRREDEKTTKLRELRLGVAAIRAAERRDSAAV